MDDHHGINQDHTAGSNPLTAHLDSVNETYWQHMGHALSFSWDMLRGTLFCLVHAFFPFLFEKSGSAIITRLHDRMVVNRKTLSPQNVHRGETVGS